MSHTLKTRLLPVLLVAAAGLFPGCGKPESLPRPEGTRELVFWHSFVAATHPALDSLLIRFHREHPDIRIRAQYVPTGDALIQKLITAVHSRTAPDIAWVHLDFLGTLVEADALVPLDEHLHRADSTETLAGDFLPGLLESARYRGRLYALPMEATSLALLYNRELFRQAGLDPEHPPADWDELRDYARRLTRDADQDGKTEQWGFYIPNFPASGSLSVWMVLQFLPYLWQAGGELVTADGLSAAFAGEAGVQALQLWKWIFDENDMRTYSLAHDLGFMSGRLAMVMDGPWNLPAYRRVPDLDWAVAALPAGPSGRATYLAGEYLVIFRQSRFREESWRFLHWFTRPDVQADFSARSGYLPVRRSTYELPGYVRVLERDPALRAFAEQLAFARTRRILGPGHVAFNQALAEAIEGVLSGDRDITASLAAAAERCEHLLPAPDSAGVLSTGTGSP